MFVAAVGTRQREADRQAFVARRANRSLAAASLVAQQRQLLDSLTPLQVASLREEFLAYCTEEPGVLKAKQLRPLLQHLGDEPDDATIRELIAVADADGNGSIDFEEFCAVLAMRTSHRHTGEDLLAAFALFDEEGRGRVKVGAVREALATLTTLSAEDVEALLITATGGDPDAEEFDMADFVELLMSV